MLNVILILAGVGLAYYINTRPTEIMNEEMPVGEFNRAKFDQPYNRINVVKFKTQAPGVEKLDENSMSLYTPELLDKWNRLIDNGDRQMETERFPVNNGNNLAQRRRMHLLGMPPM